MVKPTQTVRRVVGLVLKGLKCIVSSVFCMIGIHFLNSQITFSWFIPEFLFFVYTFKFSEVLILLIKFRERFQI